MFVSCMFDESEIEYTIHKKWFLAILHRLLSVSAAWKNPISLQGHILGKKKPVTFSGHRWLGCCHSEAFSANGTSLRSHQAKLVGGKSMAARSAEYHGIKHKTIIPKRKDYLLAGPLGPQICSS